MQAECHKGEEARSQKPEARRALPFWLLFFAHIRISIIRRGDEVLFDGSRANPAQKIHHRTGLVVGSAGARSAKRLLANYSARWFIVHIKVAGSESQDAVGTHDSASIRS